MAANQVPSAGSQRIPQNLNLQQQQQQQHPQYAIYQQQQQQQTELDQKKLLEITEALSYIAYIRDDVNIILDNVAKMNSANNYGSLLAGKTVSNKTSDPSGTPSDSQLRKSPPATSASIIPSVVGTPASVPNINSQPGNQQQQNSQVETDSPSTTEGLDDFANLDFEQQQFFSKTDTKYLQDKTVEINKNLM